MTSFGIAPPNRPIVLPLSVRRTCLLVGALLLVSVRASVASTMEVEVVGVTDGDTLTVLDRNKVQHKVRLAGIDAPERRQAFGQRAKQALASQVFKSAVVVDWHKRDRYGRLIGKVLIGDRDAGLELLRNGLAWHYKAYEQEQTQRDRLAYAEAEHAARKSHVGLWEDGDPVPPWEFRRKMRDGARERNEIAR